MDQRFDGVMRPTQDHSAPERIALRINEFALATGVSRSTVDRLIKSGGIAISKVGSITVIPVAEVRRILARHPNDEEIGT